MIDVIRNGKQGPITVDGVEFNGVMPAITTLTDAQVGAVAAYVVGLATGSAPPPTTFPPPTAGDASSGEDLFLGRTTLAAGGSACVACHAAGPHGGASLGPDLTDVFTRLGGEAGLTGWLASPPSPTMQPIFGDRPLEQAEISDVVAYLGSLPGTATDRSPDLMLIGGGLGLVVLFGVMVLIFRRPRGRYIDQLRSKP